VPARTDRRQITVSGTIVLLQQPPTGWPDRIDRSDVITTPSAVIRALGDLGGIAITANA
jgi:hypothetical protein